MKRIVLLMSLVLTLMLTSCKGEKFGIVYNASVKGDADGKVALNFPQGGLNLDGKTTLEFDAASDSTAYDQIHAAYKTVSDDECITLTNEKELRASLFVLDWFASNFNVVSYGGTYDITVDCEVIEKLTGLSVRIKRHWTNRE